MPMWGQSPTLYSAGVSGAAGGTAEPFKGPLIGSGLVRKMDPRVQARIKSAYAQLPLYFEANRGQADAPVKFAARGPGYRLLLTSSGATLVFRRPQNERASFPSAQNVRERRRAGFPVADIGSAP